MNYSGLTKRQLKQLARSYGRSLRKLNREYVVNIRQGWRYLAEANLEHAGVITKRMSEIGLELEKRG
ncbi:hypothetical protein ACWF99_23880 [Nocardia sp. NPDC055002]